MWRNYYHYILFIDVKFCELCPQTGQNSTRVFTHRLKILLFTSLPRLVSGDQQTELNQTVPNGVSSLNRVNNLRYNSCGCPSQKSGAKIFIHLCFPTIWRIIYLLNESRYRQSASALESMSGLLNRLKILWTLVHKRLKIGQEILLTVRKFGIPLHCQASQTEISKRNLTKLCKTVDSKSRQQSAVEKLGSCPPPENRPKTFLCSVFWRLRGLVANIFGMERDIDNRPKSV